LCSSSLQLASICFIENISSFSIFISQISTQSHSDIHPGISGQLSVNLEIPSSAAEKGFFVIVRDDKDRLASFKAKIISARL
jgi:hypothetical protein